MIVVALTVVVVGAPHLSTRAGAQTSPYFTLSVNPTQDVRTGQAMTFTVTRTPAGTAQGLQIYAAATVWCTANFQPPTPPERYNLTLTYGTFPVHLTNPNGHCTTVTFPLDSSFRTKAGYSPPKDSTGSYPTVSGTVAAESSGGTTLHTGTTLTCNSTHPCTFVVLVYANETGEQAPGIFLGVPVTYLPPSVNTSCGGAAPGQLTTAGPDRLAQQITNWTLEGCASDLDGGKALTDNLGSGESDATALNTFADGDADLAYSAVGYGATAAFNPPNQRPYVAVPIALNAVVLAHVQSKHVTNVAGLTNVFAKLPQLHITDAQAAQLVADGQGTNALWDSPLGEGLVSQNPTLGPPSWYYSPTTTITRNASHNNQNENNGVVGTSLADATTFFATTFLHSVAPQELVSYTGKPLGVTPDFGTATPPYNIFAATGTELVAKALSPGLGQGWALTDAASAASLWGGLSVLALQTPGSIGSPTQKYVAPTVTSMQAAVPEMIPQPDGTLLPNPDAATTNGVQAYPLTYVEYAIAPTQPLLNDNCTPRTKAQQNLVDWLNYITGPGQSELNNAMVPLTPALQRQARQAIAQVGKTTPTGPCAPVTAPASSTSSVASAASLSGSPSASAGSTAATGASGAAATSEDLSSGSTTPFGTSNSGTATSTSSVGSSTKKGASSRGLRQVAVNLAGFKSYRSADLILPVLGVLFLIVLLPGLALLVADGSLRGRLDAFVNRRGRKTDAPPGDP